MFKQLCIAENSNHHTSLMHIAVRWLSQGKTLEGVFLLRRELATFLLDKKHRNARYFHDPHFFARLLLLLLFTQPLPRNGSMAEDHGDPET